MRLPAQMAWRTVCGREIVGGGFELRGWLFNSHALTLRLGRAALALGLDFTLALPGLLHLALHRFYFSV